MFYSRLFSFISMMLTILIVAIQIFRPIKHKRDDGYIHTISFSYLKQQSGNRKICMLIGVVTSIFVFFAFSPSEAIFLIIGTLVVCVVYPATTLWRIRRGFFGTNAQEATELFEYILSYTNNGKKPPGSKVMLTEGQILSSYGSKVVSKTGARERTA